MHPLRVLLIVSLVVAAAIASAFGALLARAGVARLEVLVLAAGVFVAYLVPWTGVFLWAVRRASDLDTLIDRTVKVVEGDDARPLTDRLYHGELDDLARGIEELRGMLVRQRSSFAEHRAAVEQIVASLGEGLLAVNAKGRVVFANERVAEMFGSRGPLAGSTVAEVVRRHSVIDAIDKALHGRASIERISEGSEEDARQIEVRTFPVTSSSEIAAVALFIDMTEIERLQTIRREFIDDFSHEVRTPMAGLRSALETLDNGDVDPRHEVELRQVMLRQINRLERLVKDLSELYRIESGELVLDRRQLTLSHLLRDLCDDFRERAAGSDVRFTLRADETRTTADAVRLQQVFSNLLDNACKYSRASGEVLIEVGKDNGEAVVRISDDGEGIPPGEAERIFNRFYRADRSRSQKVPGVGLGLAIAKHLVMLHGGAIRAYNRPSGGATFEVRLPAA
jgi:signal transduction histidine kinase